MICEFIDEPYVGLPSALALLALPAGSLSRAEQSRGGVPSFWTVLVVQLLDDTISLSGSGFISQPLLGRDI